jgi:hypothetical protein
MSLVVCRMCKRAFINARDEEICPDCAAKLYELYPTVRSFLRNHENESYTVYEVSRLLGLDLRDVEGLVVLDLIRLGNQKHAQRVTKTYKDEKEEEASTGKKRKTSGSVYLSRRKKT